MLTTCLDLCSQWSLMLPLCFPVACECVCVRTRTCVCNCWQVEQTTSAALVSALQSKITSLTLENQELANKLRVSLYYSCVLQMTKPVLNKFYLVCLNQVVSIKSYCCRQKN